MKKTETNIDPFDFDALSSLAQHDPQAFESLRLQLIEEAINSAANREQRRLQGLQFQIDSYRRLAKTPMESCLKISHLMHESLDEFSNLLNLTVREPTAVISNIEQRHTPAEMNNVIPFNRPAKTAQG